jgi:hypothetical protein
VGNLNVEIEAVYDIKQNFAHAAVEGRAGKARVTPDGPVG